MRVSRAIFTQLAIFERSETILHPGNAVLPGNLRCRIDSRSPRFGGGHASARRIGRKVERLALGRCGVPPFGIRWPAGGCRAYFAKACPHPMAGQWPCWSKRRRPEHLCRVRDHDHAGRACVCSLVGCQSIGTRVSMGCGKCVAVAPFANVTLPSISRFPSPRVVDLRHWVWLNL